MLDPLALEDVAAYFASPEEVPAVSDIVRNEVDHLCQVVDGQTPPDKPPSKQAFDVYRILLRSINAEEMIDPFHVAVATSVTDSMLLRIDEPGAEDVLRRHIPSLQRDTHGFHAHVVDLGRIPGKAPEHLKARHMDIVRGRARLTTDHLRYLVMADLVKAAREAELPKNPALKEICPDAWQALSAQRTKLRRGARMQRQLGVKPDYLPPCVVQLRGLLKAGERLEHHGRFSLAAFYAGVGLKEEQIMDQFRESPKFDESLTRYQVEHILGKKTGRPYKMMACATMSEHNLCVPNSCVSKHPIGEYMRRVRARKRNNG